MKHYTHFFTLLLVTMLAPNFAHSQIINTVAGNGTAGFSGDGGAATVAELYYPSRVAVDGGGNVYVGDYANNRVRKITTAGTITTIAGNGTAGYSGDGGSAIAAALDLPCGIVVDSSHNMYIADCGNNCIRKVTPSGTISTFAGNGTAGYSGDGGAATAAKLYRPYSLAVDGSGNVYIADESNFRIRKVTSSGIISTIAGNGTAGFSGDGGPATAAQLYQPTDVGVDGSGNVYITDAANHRIRKVTPSGTISTIAGNGTVGYSGDGGAATAAELYQPYGLAVDGSGILYIADRGNHRIRKVMLSGTISTIAGNGSFGFSGDGGLATAAELYFPMGVAIDRSGNIYMADSYNHRIRKMDSCAMPDAFSISGSDSLCPGRTTALTDTAIGGTWFSANPAVATVNSTGTVTSVAPGAVNILYIVTNSCGSDTAVFPFKVRSVASCPNGVKNIEGRHRITIYPNPNNGTFAINIAAPVNEKIPVTVTNLLGKKVKEITLVTNTMTEIKLDVPAGVYFVSAATQSGVVVQNVVVRE